MSIPEYESHSIKHIVTNSHRCKTCGYVTISIGFNCSRCKGRSKGTIQFFTFGVMSLAHLMLEYHNINASPSDNLKIFPSLNSNHRLAIVVFYSSLGEVLFDDFLSHLMIKQNIPDALQDRLLSSDSMTEKLSLFHNLTDTKFSDIVKQLSRQSRIDYTNIISFYQKLRHNRNRLIHRGNIFAVTEKMQNQCLTDAYGLMKLFIDLHNKYIAKQKRKRLTTGSS